MTTQLETDRSTTTEDSFRSGPKKSKIHRIPWPGRPAPAPRTAAHATLNKEYRRALHAAEMAVWNAADRTPARPAESLTPQPARLAPAAMTLDRTLSSPECAAWIAGGLAALIAGAGLLTRITDGVLQLASVMQRIVS